VQRVELFISNGSDTNRYRDVAADVGHRLTQLLQYELGYDVGIVNWDYRRATPTVVPAGTLASTSLRMVDRAEALVAIFGRRDPTVTKEEIRQAFRRLDTGEAVDVFVFANPHERDALAASPTAP
jgi:hypothetical protein